MYLHFRSAERNLILRSISLASPQNSSFRFFNDGQVPLPLRYRLYCGKFITGTCHARPSRKATFAAVFNCISRYTSFLFTSCLFSRYMIRHLDHYLDYQREYRGGCCAPARRFLARNFYLVCGNRFGNYLLTLYLSIKVC